MIEFDHLVIDRLYDTCNNMTRLPHPKTPFFIVCIVCCLDIDIYMGNKVGRYSSVYMVIRASIPISLGR